MRQGCNPHYKLQIGPVAGVIIILLFIPGVSLFAQQEPKFFSLSDFSGALTFQYESTSEEESFYDQTFRDIDRKYLEGGILLDLAGSIYHPNFLSFKVNVNVLGHRSKNILFSDASINNAVNNTYNINLSFLKKKKFNFQLYAVRNFTTFDRAFYERVFTTYKSFGARMASRAKLFPFQLEVNTIQSKTESLFYSERDEMSKNLDLRVDLLGNPRTRSMLTFKGKDYSESVFDINYQSMDLMANLQHYYGGSKSSNILSSTFILHKMTGDNDLETYNLHNTVLHYLSKDNLYFFGFYTLLRDKSFNRSYTKHNLSGSLNHKLYESLESRLLIGGRFENSNFQEINASRYGITLNYRKKIPKGLIQLSYVNQREKGGYISKSDLASTTEIFDFSLSDSIILTQQGIAVDSIRVTDENFTYIYVEGVDYQVNIVGNVVTITRLPGGAILPGNTVAVHFEYLAYPDFNLKIRYSQFIAQLSLFKLFRVYYRKYINDQTIVSDYTIPPFESYTKTVVGAHFDTRFLTGEYYRERHDSVLSDYISQNYRLYTLIRISRFLRLSGDLTINRLKYVPEVYFSHLDAYSGECSIFPFNNLTLSGIYRNIKYTIPGVSRKRESVIVKFQWTIRRIIVDFFYEHLFTGYEFTDRAHDYASLRIRRTF
jgi:hypothetical protein